MSKPYNPHDKWLQKAKAQGYRARSVYKLQELDKKYHLLRPGMKVLDIGAAPGSWLQYITKRVGRSGQVLGLDTQKIEFVAPNAVTKVCDITQEDEVDKAITALGGERVDLIVSDLMSNTTGIKLVDEQRSIELNRQVFAIAKKWLKPNRYLVMKVFEGEDFGSFLRELKDYFSQVKIEKVRASRVSSREIYIVCF